MQGTPPFFFQSRDGGGRSRIIGYTMDPQKAADIDETLHDACGRYHGWIVVMKKDGVNDRKEALKEIVAYDPHFTDLTTGYGCVGMRCFDD